MEEVASVRSEIKAWEREFQVKHERAPTVDDIREDQYIASKYKLYKKLTKANPPTKLATSKAETSARPATPPRKTERNSSVISKSRALETTSALSSYNPFSPQKTQGKQKELAKAPHAPANPFATPSKAKPKPRMREPSPVYESAPALVLPTNLPPAPPTAVTRARKRLRGEPVSPSPNKDKRRRIVSHDSDASSSGDADEAIGNSSFVADSPLKGSSFKSLFEDASGAPAKVKSALTRTKSTSGLFGPIRSQSVPVEDDLEFLSSSKPQPRPKNNLSLSSKLMTSKDDLHTVRDAAPQASQARAAPSTEGILSNGAKSGKRRLPDSDSEAEQKPFTSALLLPPSPPRENSSQRPIDVLNKGKGKATSRKKTRLDDDDDSDMDGDVKVVSIASRPTQPISTEDDSDIGLDFDPLAWYNRRAADDREEGERVNGTFEVDLPDKLKRVLALSASDIKARDLQEETVAESLIYGRRTTHYEPSKGGEIWDVGDVAKGGQQEEEGIWIGAVDDEDWEGEPVPWEVGEL
ncbi:hypothetical protein BDP27DRAFT_1358150 [Rhodocollybia butyracea]|uniref:DNA replication regulator SLD2 n=1 Tax=Rhodocollybia butyracea TaxID=206335 RepID=A0A9P5Q7J6_9AGAR|nr:hypothetical protein BDP27DRAFT_1358150 [Rhodocollybia butyracea]